MLKYILLIWLLLSLAYCNKDNPTSSEDISQTPATNENEWVSKTNMPTARAYLCSAEVNGKIYLIGGGLDQTHNSAAVEVYDPETDKWTTKTEMPVNILGMAATALDGKIYTFGGRKGNIFSGNTLNYTYVYDPETNMWSRKANMPISRVFSTASVIDGKIYVIGGAAKEYIGLTTVQMYDPVSNNWTQKDSMKIGRALHTATVFNGKI